MGAHWGLIGVIIGSLFPEIIHLASLLSTGDQRPLAGGSSGGSLGLSLGGFWDRSSFWIAGYRGPDIIGLWASRLIYVGLANLDPI